MIDKQKITTYINNQQYDSALSALDLNVENSASEAEEWLMMRGQLHWRLGHRGAAMTDMEQAASMNPSGKAASYLAHYREIMDFFSPDQFNP